MGSRGLMNYYCQCCGYPTLDSRNEFDICPICFWEDDGFQNDSVFFTGANSVGLVIAKYNYQNTGAVDTDALKHVKSCPSDLIRDPEFKTWQELTKINIAELHDYLLNEYDDNDSAYDQNLNFYLIHIAQDDISFFYKLGKELFNDDTTMKLWIPLATKYFKQFTDNETLKLKEHLIDFYGESFDEFKNILLEI